jgi:hypothetical protein
MALLLLVIAVAAFVLGLSFTGMYFLNKSVNKSGR